MLSQHVVGALCSRDVMNHNPPPDSQAGTIVVWMENSTYYLTHVFCRLLGRVCPCMLPAWVLLLVCASHCGFTGVSHCSYGTPVDHACMRV